MIAPADGGLLVREDSHRITAPVTQKAQLVEFLDFECESCRSPRRSDPVPGQRMDSLDAVQPSAAEAGQDVVICRVSDEGSEMLRSFANNVLTPGAGLAVRAHKAFSSGTTVHVSGANEDLTLGPDAAGALWVEKQTRV